MSPVADGMRTALARVLRLRAWHAFIDSNIRFSVMAVACFGLVCASNYSTLQLLLLLVAVLLALMNGLLVNDYSDVNTDLLYGKVSAVANISPRTVLAAIVLLFLLGLAIVGFGIGQISLVLVYLGWYFLGVEYSAPPLRLKGQTIHGIWSNVLVEKTIPAFFIAAFFGCFGFFAWFVLACYSMVQIEIIFHHQIDDYEGDTIAGVNTLVTRLGRAKAMKNLNSYLRPLTAVSIAGLLLLFSVTVQYFWLTIPVCVVGYFIVAWLVSADRLIPENPQCPLYYNYLYFFLEGPAVVLIALLATLKRPDYVVFLGLAMFSQYPKVRYYSRGLKAILRRDGK